MTQTPITVTYTLEEILGQIKQSLANVEQKIDKVERKVDNLQESVNEIKIGQVKLENELKGEIRTLDAKLTGEIKAGDLMLGGEIKTLGATVEGIGKRLDTQEFINRSVVVGFVLAVGAAVTKILFPNWLA